MSETSIVISGRILVVDDHAEARRSIAEVLTHIGHQVECAANATDALKRLSQESYDVVLTDLQMPGLDGLDFIEQIVKRGYGSQVAMVTAHATVTSAVKAMRLGAFDYIEKPLDLPRLENLVARCLEHGRCLDRRHLEVRQAEEQIDIVGSSPLMAMLKERMSQVAPTPETVLIYGESGTGKELVARAVHHGSRRMDKPFVELNCPVLSEQLMESELFGHERGAFTGADSKRTGRFELAHEGTILLDEITEIGLGLQAKLLRVLQEKEFQRVGSSSTVRVDTRVLATTNRDLAKEVSEGRFRQDLYYRINVLPLEVPPLRQRREDIPALTEHFLTRAAQRLERDPCSLDRSAADLLQHYHWPGNVRELQNIVTRACVLFSGSTVAADVLRPWLLEAGQANDEPITVGLRLDEMERKLIEATLDHYGGHRAKTADALGIGLRTLTGKLKAYGHTGRSSRAGSAA